MSLAAAGSVVFASSQIAIQIGHLFVHYLLHYVCTFGKQGFQLYSRMEKSGQNETWHGAPSRAYREPIIAQTEDILGLCFIGFVQPINP